MRGTGVQVLLGLVAPGSREIGGISRNIGLTRGSRILPTVPGLTGMGLGSYRSTVAPGRKATLGLSCFMQRTGTVDHAASCRAPIRSMRRGFTGSLVALALSGLGCSAGKADQDWLGAKDSTQTGAAGSSGVVGSGEPSASAATTTGVAGSSLGTPSHVATTGTLGSGETQSASWSSSSSSVFTTEPDDDTGTEEPLPAGQGYACGIKISRVSINQSVEVALSRGAELLPKDGSRNFIWEGRRSLFRVYLSGRSMIPKGVRVTLEVTSVDETWKAEKPLVLIGASSALSMESTANFVVPDRMISPKSTFRVLVKQDEPCTPGPQDRAMVPRHGTWGLGARKAPRVDIQFVRVRFTDEQPLKARSKAFKDKLRSALYARYPISQVRFNLWDALTATAKGSASTSANPAKALLDQVAVLKSTFDDNTPTLHYVGLSVMKQKIAGISSTPDEDLPGISVVNANVTENELIERIVSVVARLHGLGDDHCVKGSSPIDPEKIGAWGFDAREDIALDPFGHYDVSCGKNPDWIHRTSYVDFARRAEKIAEL